MGLAHRVRIFQALLVYCTRNVDVDCDTCMLVEVQNTLWSSVNAFNFGAMAFQVKGGSSLGCIGRAPGVG